MSDSVRPRRRQPTRLLCPWDSGKNTGVGCHFHLQCMKVKSESEVAQSWLTLSDPMDCSPPGSSIHGIFQARGLEWGAISFSGGLYWISKKKKWPASAKPSKLGQHDHITSFGIIGIKMQNKINKPLKPENNKYWQEWRESRTLVHC